MCTYENIDDNIELYNNNARKHFLLPMTLIK